MAGRVAYFWRVFRTGLGFGMFGAGALFVTFCIFPLVQRLPGDPDRRAQRLVHITFRLWVSFATALGLLRVRWSGVDRLRTMSPCIVVANHPTLIDIVLLIARLPQADCVVKAATWRNPVIKGVVARAGYIRNDDGAALIDMCVSRVRERRWLVLFPEGTRSPARCLAPFHRGAAHVALRSGAPLLPVVITCNPPTLGKDQRWYHVPERAVQFTVQVGEPIAIDEFLQVGGREAVAARGLTATVRTILEQGLSRADA